ncbi:unnamed protein product [Moneuplotes crassus]|uniref:Uncharacterized protein n=1 Tax=Euplotes crassus TaxID=5936 RepID=A0AAD1XP56_EUPCR|nr:unnamed protein product [Moneuplotes crassus]
MIFQIDEETGSDTSIEKPRKSCEDIVPLIPVMGIIVGCIEAAFSFVINTHIVGFFTAISLIILCGVWIMVMIRKVNQNHFSKIKTCIFLMSLLIIAMTAFTFFLVVVKAINFAYNPDVNSLSLQLMFKKYEVENERLLQFRQFEYTEDGLFSLFNIEDESDKSILTGCLTPNIHSRLQYLEINDSLMLSHSSTTESLLGTVIDTVIAFEQTEEGWRWATSCTKRISGIELDSLDDCLNPILDCIDQRTSSYA